MSVQAQKWSSCIDVLILNLDFRWRWDINATHPPKSAPVVIKEACWAAGPVWPGTEMRKSLPPTRVQNLACPAHSNLLYQLHHPDPNEYKYYIQNWK
jgi:hypothetical protein